MKLSFSFSVVVSSSLSLPLLLLLLLSFSSCQQEQPFGFGFGLIPNVSAFSPTSLSRVNFNSNSNSNLKSKFESELYSSKQPTDNNNNNNSNNNNAVTTSSLGKACASAFLTTCLLWGSPTILAEQFYQNDNSNSNDNSVTVNVNVMLNNLFMAQAKDKASATGSRVNKDAESLLRYGLPIDNKQVRSLQESLETIKYDISSKRKAAALDGIKKSKSLLMGKNADKMIASCRDEDAKIICTDLIAQIDAGLDPLQSDIKASQDAFTGSEQEREALDKAYVNQEKLTKLLTSLEEQMIPQNYETPVPDVYSDLPQLKRRATVEMIIKKPVEGDKFDVNGVNFPQAKLVMVIDGYTAPVTGGNFVDLVQKGFYNNMAIQRSDGFVVQTGDPEGAAFGYTGGKPSKSIGAGPHGERLIPTEIFVRGDKGPFYESTIEDEGRGGEATILPFSSYGAMGWARDEYDVNSGSSQFFWLLFDSDLTPAGKNVLDGRYPCFGYVVEGSDFLSDIKEGDIIVSAKVTEGLEYLVQPKE